MKLILTSLSLILTLSAFGYGWEQKADFGGLARHRTTALAIGNHIYFGLGHFNGAGPNILFEDWWEYDPASNAWTQKANYLGGPMYHAAAFTIGNKGYVGTGRNPGAQLVKTFFSYDPTSNSWEQLQNFPGSGRRGGVGFAIDGFGYMGTGSYNNDFYRFDPVSGNWTAVASMPTGGRISAVGFELDGYGYVGTGSVSGATNDFWRYDATANSWNQMANVGPTSRQEASGFSVNGKGYILTGDDYSSGNNFGDMWEFEPTTNTWIQLDDFPGTARRYLSCVTLGNYAYAGLGTNGTNFKDFWLYDQVADMLERNIDQVNITAYPNPSTDFVKFEFVGLDNIAFENLELNIVSITGHQVYSETLKASDMTVVTRDMQAGNYLYQLSYNGRAVKSGKLIIQ